MNEFTKMKESHSNEILLETGNKFQDNAKIAAVTKALKNELIIDKNDLKQINQINVESNNLKEKIVDDGLLEFNKKFRIILLVLIFNFIWVFIVVQINYKELSNFDLWYPVAFSISMYACFKNYNKVFAKILIWLTAFTLVKTVLSIIFTLYYLL